MDDSLRGNDLARKLDLRLGRANDIAALVFISILRFRLEVNRADDIAVAVVDTEKLTQPVSRLKTKNRTGDENSFPMR